jgi:uncharacterized protein YunC (DUF1805 family)
MFKGEVARCGRGRVIAMDSITKVASGDEGAFVVSASHGGASSGEFALAVALGGVFFNDAGVGKEGAGIVALDMLEKRSIPAGTVAHTSARIGDAIDTWENGVVSHVNASAEALGIKPGQPLKSLLNTVIAEDHRQI